MKKLLYSSLLILFVTDVQAQSLIDTLRHKVLLETDSGNIRTQLYNETPRHRNNFLELVYSGVYNGVLFHRVIKDSTIQSGNMVSKAARPRRALDGTSETYSLPAGIDYPKLLYRRDATTAVRENDDVSPKRKSSASRFYIVWGIKFSGGQLDWAQGHLNIHTGSMVQMTPEVRRIYKEVGGAPHLDGQCIVSGQALEGLDVVERVQRQPVDANDRSLADARVRRATVLR